jgi:dTMP kinase
MMTGQYVVFEGTDGCGKTSVSKMVSQKLQEEGQASSWSGHPGSTPIGQKLRELIKYSEFDIDPFTEQLLMVADNSAFIHLKLKQELEAGLTVIADRCNFTGAYPYGVSAGNSIEDMKTQHAVLKDRWVPIDRLIIFNIDWETAKERMLSDDVNGDERQKCRIEKRGDAYFENVCKMYKEMAQEGTELNDIAKNFAHNVHVVDASQDISHVFDQCMQIIYLGEVGLEMSDE